MRTVVTDYDMVVERDADNLASFAEALRFLDVLLGRRRIAARMVVRDDHGHRAKSDGMAEDFSRMEKRLVRRATRNHHRLAEKMPFRVEIERIRTFLRFIDTDGSHLPHHVVRCLDCAGEGAMRSAANCTAATLPMPGTFAATICCHVAVTSFDVPPKWLISRWARSIALEPLHPVRISMASKLASGISRSGAAERMNASRGLASIGKSFILSGSAISNNHTLVNQGFHAVYSIPRRFAIMRSATSGLFIV